MATKINFYDLRDKLRNLKSVDKDVMERAFIAGLQVIAEHLIEEKVVKGKRTPENVLIAAWEISGRQRNEFGRAFVTKQAVTRALVECFGLKISSSETIMYSFKHKSNPVTPLAAAGLIAIEKDTFFIDNLLSQHKEEVEKRGEVEYPISDKRHPLWEPLHKICGGIDKTPWKSVKPEITNAAIVAQLVMNDSEREIAQQIWDCYVAKGILSPKRTT